MKDLARKYKGWRVQRQRRLKVVRQLSAYTDRDLLDLGFSRHDFPAIINGTYQRAKSGGFGPLSRSGWHRTRVPAVSPFRLCRSCRCRLASGAHP